MPVDQNVLVVRRTANEVAWDGGRDVWWHDAVADAAAECEPEEMGAEDMLYLLYTSGTTAKPKGICTPRPATCWGRCDPPVGVRHPPGAGARLGAVIQRHAEPAVNGPVKASQGAHRKGTSRYFK